MTDLQQKAKGEKNEMLDKYEHGLRLVFGDGKKCCHAGTIEGVPAFIVSNLGIGEVGADPGIRGELPSGTELCAFIFESVKSLDVVIEEMLNVRALMQEGE